MKLSIVRIALVVTSYALSYFLAWYFGLVYSYLFPRSLGGGSIISVTAMEWIVGFPLSVIFTLTFLLIALDQKYKWWWIVISLLPVILLEIVYDPLHVYFPVIFGLAAWGLGTIAHKTLQKLAPSFMEKIS